MEYLLQHHDIQNAETQTQGRGRDGTPGSDHQRVGTTQGRPSLGWVGEDEGEKRESEEREVK